jgi:hypothetical protein
MLAMSDYGSARLTSSFKFLASKFWPWTGSNYTDTNWVERNDILDAMKSTLRIATGL